MNLVRVGIPAIVGALAVWFGVQHVLEMLSYPEGSSLILAALGAVYPIAIGLGLLLVAVGVARRTRLAYLLGLVLALGFIGLAAWFIVSSIPHLSDGPWNLYPIAIGAAVLVIIVALGYAASLRQARAAFAAAWGREDQLLALTLAFVAVFAVTLSFTLGSVVADADTQAQNDSARFQALVAASDFEVRVVSATLDPAQTAPLVDHLTLEVTLRNAPIHEVDTAPVLCLTDEVTYTDMGKLGTLCFGAQDPGRSLDLAFNDMATTSDGVTFQVELDRGRSECAYLTGPWVASLGYVRNLPGAETFWKQSSFTVAAGPGASPSTGLESPEPCGISK